MPRVKRKGPDHREQWRGGLDILQYLTLTIGSGGGPAGNGFDSEDDARAAWRFHRDALMAEHGRCAAWWKYEKGEPAPSRIVRGVEFPPPWTAAHVRLFELGELTEEEVRDLDRRARSWKPKSMESPRRWTDARIDAFLQELRQQGTEGKP